MPNAVENTPNLSDIENNEIAQTYLLKRSDEISRDELFEEIYQSRVASGKEMMKRRAMKKEADRKQPDSDKPSFLDTKEKEQAYYDEVAKEDTVKAMLWLDKKRALLRNLRVGVDKH